MGYAFIIIWVTTICHFPLATVPYRILTWQTIYQLHSSTVISHMMYKQTPQFCLAVKLGIISVDI